MKINSDQNFKINETGSFIKDDRVSSSHETDSLQTPIKYPGKLKIENYTSLIQVLSHKPQKGLTYGICIRKANEKPRRLSIPFS